MQSTAETNGVESTAGLSTKELATNVKVEANNAKSTEVETNNTTDKTNRKLQQHVSEVLDDLEKIVNGMKNTTRVLNNLGEAKMTVLAAEKMTYLKIAKKQLETPMNTKELSEFLDELNAARAEWRSVAFPYENVRNPPQLEIYASERFICTLIAVFTAWKLYKAFM